MLILLIVFLYKNGDEIMKLKLGKMSSKEIAQWFGLSYGSYRVKKKDKLEELKDYADYEEVYGGVNIKNIKEEEYSKEGKRSKEIVFNAFDEEWNESGLDTCSNVAFKIYNKHKNELTIAEGTTYNYMNYMGSLFNLMVS